MSGLEPPPTARPPHATVTRRAHTRQSHAFYSAFKACEVTGRERSADTVGTLCDQELCGSSVGVVSIVVSVVISGYRRESLRR